MNYEMIIHGSENSLDKDAYILVPEPLDRAAAKGLCDSFRDVNANLISIKDGIVSWCYKGTKDECNNSILLTYHLHKQMIDNPIKNKLERQYGLKMIRSMRGMLSYFSRTEYREVVKKALQSGDLLVKLNTLKEIEIDRVEDFQKTTKIEVYKFFAFQMGQTLSLLEDNEELFTKNTVSEKYPQLQKYLKREAHPVDDLKNFYDRFVDFISQNVHPVQKHPFFWTKFHGKTEVIDCKKEVTLPPVVVFDIDGTLADESHRSHLREDNRFDEYFAACGNDSPIIEIIDLTKQYKEAGYEVWLMSGRSESCMKETIDSMNKMGVRYDHIKLRGKDNFIPDYVLKPAWIGKYIGKERVECIYDDTDKVIEGFRAKGLKVIDVKTLLEKSESSKKFNF